MGDDGRFANKVEIRRFNRSSSRGDDDEESSAGGSSSLLKRAVGLLGGKDGNQLAGTEAADTAGVAVGSSFWMAAKEAKGMADEVKEALSERDISSTKRAKAYAKDKALKLWGALKRPFGGQAGSEPGAGDATPDTPPATPANAANAEPKPASTIGIGEKKNQEQTESARLDAIRRKEDAQSKEQHSEVIDRLDALIDSSKTKPRSLTDVVGDKVKDWIGERGISVAVRAGRVPKAGVRDRLAVLQTGKPARAERAASRVLSARVAAAWAWVEPPAPVTFPICRPPVVNRAGPLVGKVKVTNKLATTVNLPYGTPINAPNRLCGQGLRRTGH